MYDVRKFLDVHHDNQQLRDLIIRLLEIWREQDLSRLAAEDEILIEQAQDIGMQLRLMHGLTADAIEVIWDNEEDFRDFLRNHPTIASTKEPA